jgi:hypothetical protein
MKKRNRKASLSKLQEDADSVAKVAAELPPAAPPSAEDIAKGKLPSRKELVDICMKNVTRAENLDDAVTVNKSVATAAEICGYIGRAQRGGADTESATAEAQGITPEILSQSIHEVEKRAKMSDAADKKFLKKRRLEATKAAAETAQDSQDQNQKA